MEVYAMAAILTCVHQAWNSKARKSMRLRIAGDSPRREERRRAQFERIIAAVVFSHSQGQQATLHPGGLLWLCSVQGARAVQRSFLPFMPTGKAKPTRWRDIALPGSRLISISAAASAEVRI